MAITAQNTKVVTAPVRLSYVHLNEPYSQNPEKADPKYSVVLLVPKSDRATIKKLRDAQKAALENGKTTKFNGVIPKNWKDTIHDGDEEADLDKNPEMAGCWYLTVSSVTKPGIVDRNVDPILDSTEIYSGMYARVSLNAFPYNTEGSRGVSFGLNHVQKIKDGDSLGGRARVEDDFDEYESDDEDDLL